MQKKYTIPLLVIGGLVAWFSIYYSCRHLMKLDHSESLNTTNSMLAALGFAGVIVTIFIQQKELSLQIQELRDTRSEFEQQNKTLKKQRFENTFFNQLDLHNSISERILINDGRADYKSKDAIRFFYNEYRGAFLNAYHEMGNPPITKDSIDDHRRLILRKFSEVYLRFEEHFGHYFRGFVGLVEFVKLSDLIEDHDRQQYFSIIRSQLNSYEIVTHFYNFNAGFATQQKAYFDLLLLGSILNSSLLLHIEHTYIYDPPEVIESALSLK